MISRLFNKLSPVIGGCLLMSLALAVEASAQPASGGQLWFREDWKEIPAATPVTQEHVNNPELTLHTYGRAKDSIKKSHHDQPANDPYYIWSGECRGGWGLTLSEAGSGADFAKGGVIRWRSRQSGERFPRLLIRLRDGTFYVSDQTDTNSSEWHIFSFILERVTWSALDIEKFVPVPGSKKPNLAQVAEVGFTDLEPGRGSNLSSRIDWIEVYAPTATR
ncbi:MAG: hypothetical protein EHM18_19120 [Acidobacteria bacterium]|nr:MAG: hypothetical protein EHM18_19120 [Acidobacteriota bacterium]